MKKINLAITGCLGRMGQQLIKSSKTEKNFKLVSVTENRMVNKKVSGLKPQLNSKNAFKNAKYWTNKDHWKWAINPNNREKASFLKENIMEINVMIYFNSLLIFLKLVNFILKNKIILKKMFIHF